MLDSRRNAMVMLVAAHLIAGALFLAPGYIRPDSVAVYSYLRSAVRDGDFVFYDEWALSGMVRNGLTFFSEVTATGTLANHWWIGTSLLTWPAYVCVRALELVAPRLTGRDGFSALYGTMLAWCSVAFVAVAMAIAWRMMRDAKPLERAIALAAVMLGTPLFWYTYRFPLGTHAAGTMCVALIVTALFMDDVGDIAAGAAVGAATGLAIATRLQHFVLIPAVVWASVRARRKPAYWIAAVVAGAIPLLCQAIAWTSIYGTPFGPLTRGANLEQTTWMPFRHFAFGPVLFGSYHGLLSWSPVVAIAIAGWVIATRGADGKRRTIAITFLLMFAFEWIANATLDRYFWGGMSFGGRRFVDLALPFALGIAWFTAAAGRRVAIALCTICVAWSVALMTAAAAGTISLARYVSAAGLIEAAFATDTWRRASALFRHSPVTDERLAMQSIVALLIIGLIAFGISRIGRNSAAGQRAAVAYALICLAGTSCAAFMTPRRAAAEAARFRIDTVASSRFGALFDERGLLLDEIAWSKATGDTRRAAATSEEIAAIDRQLDAIMANRSRR